MHLLGHHFIRLAKDISGLPCGSDSKESASNVEDLGLIPGEGNANTLQYSLENPMDRGARVGYSPWGHKESDITE